MFFGMRLNRKAYRIFPSAMFCLRSFIICILLHLLCIPARAQNQSDSSFIRNYTKDVGRYISSPYHWNGKEWLTFAGIATTSAVMMHLDAEVHEFISDNRDGGMGGFSKQFLEPFGNGAFSLPVIAALGGYGLITRQKEHIHIAGAGFEAFAFSAGLATAFKWGVQRHRPNDDISHDPFHFEGPMGNERDNGSFVSRHAATSFALATVLASTYGQKRKWISWVSYGLAGAVTVSRVYNGNHWVSDAFAGAALGFFTGKFVVRMNRDRNVAAFRD